MTICKTNKGRLTRAGVAILSAFAFVAVSFGNAKVVDAACAALPTDYGSATQAVNVTTAGTYRVWSRMMAPDTNNNSYYLEIDDTTCGVAVGGGAMTANTWNWVDYRDGNTASKVNVTLSAGTHTLRYVGREASVKLDRVLLLSDTACVPTGMGDNCTTVATDTIAPVVSVVAPTNGSSVSNTVNVTATATDAVGVTKVDFLVDGVVKATDTASPYNYSWDTKTVANGAHTVSARAYDAANNNSTATVNVTVANSTTPPPTKQGDINGDTKIDIFDLGILLQAWNTTSTTANIDGTGKVDIFDLGILLSKWGT